MDVQPRCERQGMRLQMETMSRAARRKSSTPSKMRLREEDSMKQRKVASDAASRKASLPRPLSLSEKVSVEEQQVGTVGCPIMEASSRPGPSLDNLGVARGLPVLGPRPVQGTLSEEKTRPEESAAVVLPVEVPTASPEGRIKIDRLDVASGARNSPANEVGAHSNSVTEDLVVSVCSLDLAAGRCLLKFSGTLAGLPVVFMIDGGATGDFVSRAFVDANRLVSRVVHPGARVRLADGEPQDCSREMSKAHVKIGSYRDRLRLRVTDLQGFDVILGKPWLARINPDIDWQTNVVKFIFDSKPHIFTPQDMTPSGPSSSLPCSWLRPSVVGRMCI